jgi:hypothetical protein
VAVSLSPRMVPAGERDNELHALAEDYREARRIAREELAAVRIKRQSVAGDYDGSDFGKRDTGPKNASETGARQLLGYPPRGN